MWRIVRINLQRILVVDLSMYLLVLKRGTEYVTYRSPEKDFSDGKAIA
jgi:hypothetical protein